jgi:hypothetical protein
MAIAKAKAAPQHLDLKWSAFLNPPPVAQAEKKAPAKKAAPKKSAAKKSSAKKPASQGIHA